MTDESDQTLINRVVRKVRREQWDGPEKRAPQPLTVLDYMKFLPLVVAVIAGAIGYGALQTRVDRLEQDRIEQRDMNKELWKAIRK